ncbi:MAG: catechol 1,2-dioxygenase [Polyangiaceae bacterium]
MGKIVGGLLCTHIPRLMIRDAAERKAYMGDNVTTMAAALEEIRREVVDRLEFDTFAIVDTHWHTTLDFVLNAHERLEGLYTSDEVPHMLHEYAYAYRGDPELAQAIAEEGAAAGLPVIASSHRGLPVHYGTLNPMHYLNPGAKRSVLSMSVCDTAEIHHNLDFGAALRRAIERLGRRVLLVASGGLSHRFWSLDTIREHAGADPSEISTPQGRAWDERLIAALQRGAHGEVIESADAFRRECAPEGRFAHYLVLAGAFGGEKFHSPGRRFGRYEAAIGTGQVNLWFPAL